MQKEGLNHNTYYRWNKEFLEAGKKRLEGYILREATSSEVSLLRDENGQLKHPAASFRPKEPPSPGKFAPVWKVLNYVDRR